VDRNSNQLQERKIRAAGYLAGPQFSILVGNVPRLRAGRQKLYRSNRRWAFVSSFNVTYALGLNRLPTGQRLVFNFREQRNRSRPRCSAPNPPRL